MPQIQDWIHKLEEGSGIRYLKIIAICLLLVLFVGGYNLRAYRNMSARDAMDAAQVARNVSEGNGFTTRYVRPFSVYLVKTHNEANAEGATAEEATDFARLKEMHPDLANAPAYPLVLAGWMKVSSMILGAAEGVRGVLPNFLKNRLPEFTTEMDGRLWQKNKGFWWHPDDFMIAMFNEALFFVVVWLSFLLARRLFDRAVAWLTAVLLLGYHLLWGFSTSGLSTMLLLVIFMGLVWFLVLLESEAREPKGAARRLFLLAGGAGVLLVLGALTRYSFGWLLIPVLVFLMIFGGARKMALSALVFVILLAGLSPWVLRNFSVSGTPFGTAGYAIYEQTAFRGDQLERSLNPRLKLAIRPIVSKLLVNSRKIVQEEVPTMAGGWVTPLFLAGLLLSFNNPAIRRLRYLLLGCLATLIVVQALGQTHLTEDSPTINSENLLVLLAPLVTIFAVGLFFVLLEQLSIQLPWLRYSVVVVFVLLACFPVLSAFLPPRTIPVAYPPYFPPRIQLISGWMKENEMMMSDMPWAVAWYGKQQCLLLTQDADEDFFAINDYMKPVRALYLTQLTIDGRFLTDWVRAGEASWGAFIVDAVLNKRIPRLFPLRIAPPPEMPFLPEQLFLTDRERWKTVETSD